MQATTVYRVLAALLVLVTVVLLSFQLSVAPTLTLLLLVQLIAGIVAGFGIGVVANLHAWRADRGRSQESLAELVGVHRTYMGGLERGERNLTLRSMERIATALGVESLSLI